MDVLSHGRARLRARFMPAAKLTRLDQVACILEQYCLDEMSGSYCDDTKRRSKLFRADVEHSANKSRALRDTSLGIGRKKIEKMEKSVRH